MRKNKRKKTTFFIALNDWYICINLINLYKYNSKTIQNINSKFIIKFNVKISNFQTNKEQRITNKITIK